MDQDTAAFLEAKVSFRDVGTASLAFRAFGSGPPALLIHGWPLWGVTWRRLLPTIASERTCHVVDLPGAGDTVWSEGNDFSFHGHARNLARLADALGWSSFDVVAHDTGATTARYLAWLLGSRVRSLVLIDTEIPHHRPPMIEELAALLTMPGATAVFRALLRSRRFLRSKYGFGGCFADRALIDGDFTTQIIDPLLSSNRRMRGQIEYVKGIDWQQVDELSRIHTKLTMPVTLVWGTRDPFFPIDRARAMAADFPDYRGMHVLEGGRLLTHEEYPGSVGGHVREFWRSVGPGAP